MLTRPYSPRGRGGAGVGENGVTPAQTVEKLVPHAIKKWGKKVNVVAAGYNCHPITSRRAKKHVQENGCEFASIDSFPLDVTNVSSTISTIQAAKPNFVWSSLVGDAHISFNRLWAAAGMRKTIPIASTAFAVGNTFARRPIRASGVSAIVLGNCAETLP